METTRLDIMRKVVKNIDSNTEFVLATVVQGAEGSPGRSGFKLICYPNGSFEGTVGGGELERLIIKESLSSKEPETLGYSLAQKLLDQGAGELLAECFAANEQ
jgi:xanthine/CO dehydrogenase XdhC/CoxF family maturation factor